MKMPKLAPLFRRAPALLCIALVSTVPSSATLLVYEGFDGYTAGTLAGQTPNTNTIGLDGNIGYYDGAGTRTANYTLATGLTLGALQTSGGALDFTIGTNVIGADIDIEATPFTGTLWSSYLVRLTTKGIAGGDGTVVRVGDKPSDSSTSRFSSWADSRVSSTNAAVGYASGATASLGNGSLALNTTHILVHRFTHVGELLSPSTPGVATLWALTESQFSTFIAAGGDEAALENASVVATATHTVTSGTWTFTSNHALGIVTVNDAGVVDEFRFGSTLADVTPVPEPATAALLVGIGCAALCSTRRSRRTGRLT